MYVCVNLAMVQCSSDFKNISAANKENQLYASYDNISKSQANIVSLPMVRSGKKKKFMFYINE